MDGPGGLECGVRHSVAIYGQLLLICDQSMLRRPGTAARVEQMRRERHTLHAETAGELAGATRSRLRQAFERMHILC